MAAHGRVSQTGRRYSPRRDIALALAFKAIALTVLYYLFFAQHQVIVTPDRVATLLGMAIGGGH